MVRRNGYTLLELIFVVVIISFLSVATYKALQMIMVRSYKAKEIARLSLESQVAVDVIASYLKNRIPYTTIGYDPNSGYEYIGELTSNKPILEWYSRAIEALKAQKYSQFIDMEDTNKSSKVLYSPDTNGNHIKGYVRKKYNYHADIYTNKIVNLVFVGSFERGAGESNTYNDAYGWHGGLSKDSFDISIHFSGKITITDSDTPKFIYEKFFLADGAYAIARGADIDKTASCITSTGIGSSKIDNTLFLFYNYRPWKGETFCADANTTGVTPSGGVGILLQDVQGFRFELLDHTIRIALDINKTIKGTDVGVHLSKMKVVF